MIDGRMKKLVEALASGKITPEEAMRSLEDSEVADIGFARVDYSRGERQALPEVVFAQGKEPGEVLRIMKVLLEKSGLAIASRVDTGTADVLLKEIPAGTWHGKAGVFTAGELSRDEGEPGGSVAVLTAGSSDIPVAEEAAVILETMGIPVSRFYDVGVSGLHRLGGVVGDIRKATVCVVCAGMDAALPSVVGGLFRGPVIAVPVSTGYGTAFGGVAALLSCLNSCSPGITVMNIDNGVGAAAAALRILRG
jgi:NCAIR mutase (PurE)-related protein